MGRKKPNKVESGTIKYADPRDAYLSTKSPMVVAKTSIALSSVYHTPYKDTAVIAEDKNGFYVTGTSYVDALVMDPFRQTERKKITVTKTETGFDIETVNGQLYSITV